MGGLAFDQKGKKGPSFYWKMWDDEFSWHFKKYAIDISWTEISHRARWILFLYPPVRMKSPASSTFLDMSLDFYCKNTLKLFKIKKTGGFYCENTYFFISAICNTFHKVRAPFFRVFYRKNFLPIYQWAHWRNYPLREKRFNYAAQLYWRHKKTLP